MYSLDINILYIVPQCTCYSVQSTAVVKESSDVMVASVRETALPAVLARDAALSWAAYR